MSRTSEWTLSSDQSNCSSGHGDERELTLRYLGRRFLPGRCWDDTPSSHTSPWGGRGGNPVLPEPEPTQQQNRRMKTDQTMNILPTHIRVQVQYYVCSVCTVCTV